MAEGKIEDAASTHTETSDFAQTSKPEGAPKAKNKTRHGAEDDAVPQAKQDAKRHGYPEDPQAKR